MASGMPCRAGGDIAPARFVMYSTARNATVLQATAGAKIAGISGYRHRLPEITELGIGSARLHAVAGEDCEVHDQDGEKQPLEIGATVTRGQRLKADATGRGIPAVSGDEYGAVCPFAAAVGDVVTVNIEKGKLA